METTDSQFLPYPEGTDPGAGALDLQVLAEAIDAKLASAFSSFRDVVNSHVFMARLSANQTGIASGTTTTIQFDQTVFNSTNPETAQSPNVPFFTKTGYYRVGSYVVSNPSGGVTANSSVRTFIVYRRQLITPLLGFTEEFFDTTTYQSSTGGEEQSAEGLIRVDALTNPGSFIRCDILHANVASTLNVIAGSRMWFYWVSDLED